MDASSRGTSCAEMHPRTPASEPREKHVPLLQKRNLLLRGRDSRVEPVTWWDERAAQARERLDTPAVENALSVLSRFLTGKPLRETFAWQHVQVVDLPERLEWIGKKSPLPYTDILWNTISRLGQGVQNTPYRFIQRIRALNQTIR